MKPNLSLFALATLLASSFAQAKVISCKSLVGDQWPGTKAEWQTGLEVNTDGAAPIFTYTYEGGTKTIPMISTTEVCMWNRSSDASQCRKTEILPESNNGVYSLEYVCPETTLRLDISPADPKYSSHIWELTCKVTSRPLGISRDLTMGSCKL